MYLRSERTPNSPLASRVERGWRSGWRLGDERVGRSLAGGSLPSRVVVGAHPTRLPGEWGRGQPPAPDAKREKPLVRVSILAIASRRAARFQSLRIILVSLVLAAASFAYSPESILTKNITLPSYTHALPVPFPALSISVFLAGSRPEVSRPRATFAADRKWSTAGCGRT